MSADILTRKYDKVFSLYDTDGNGYVEQADVKRMQGQFLAAFGEDPASPKGLAVRERWDGFWHALTEVMDRDLDDRLTHEEFVGGLKQLSDDVDAFEHVFRPVIEAVFTLMDSDDNGIVTDEEFRSFQAGVGNADQADAALAKIDRDADGVITLDELVADIRDFLTSDDPENSNNWFLGQV